MKNAVDFTIQNLLSEKGNIITGPMPPLFFDKTTKIHKNVNMLARVCFADESILQYQEEDGDTRHDFLIIGTELHNDLQLSLWIEDGVRGIPIAMALQSNQVIMVTPFYQKKKYFRKLSTEEIQEIFTYLFNNLHLLATQHKRDEAV